MISIEQCKKHLKNCDYSDEEIREIRDILYQLGEMLFDMSEIAKGSKYSAGLNSKQAISEHAQESEGRIFDKFMKQKKAGSDKQK